MSTQAQSLLELRNPYGSSQSSRAPILAVTGGKGGIGKSTIAANLAISLSQRGTRGLASRVLLADLDLGLASTDAILGLTRPGTSADFLDGQATLESAVVRGPGFIDVLPAPRGIAKYAALDSSRRARLLDELLRASALRDFVILDMPAGIHPDGLEISQRSDILLVVTTPEPASIADAYAVIKLATQSGCSSRLGLIVNEVSGPLEARQISDRFSAVTQRFLGRAIDTIGWIPRDPAVMRATTQRRPVVLCESGSPAASAFRLLAARVEGMATEFRSRWHDGGSSLRA